MPPIMISIVINLYIGNVIKLNEISTQKTGCSYEIFVIKHAPRLSDIQN